MKLKRKPDHLKTKSKKGKPKNDSGYEDLEDPFLTPKPGPADSQPGIEYPRPLHHLPAITPVHWKGTPLRQTQELEAPANITSLNAMIEFLIHHAVAKSHFSYRTHNHRLIFALIEVARFNDFLQIQERGEDVTVYFDFSLNAVHNLNGFIKDRHLSLDHQPWIHPHHTDQTRDICPYCGQPMNLDNFLNHAVIDCLGPGPCPADSEQDGSVIPYYQFAFFTPAGFWLCWESSEIDRHQPYIILTDRPARLEHPTPGTIAWILPYTPNTYPPEVAGWHLFDWYLIRPEEQTLWLTVNRINYQPST